MAKVGEQDGGGYGERSKIVREEVNGKKKYCLDCQWRPVGGEIYELYMQSSTYQYRSRIR